MMEPITQSILLAQERGGDWANLLFIVIMAILWLVAGLIKAMSKKRPPQEESKPQGSLAQRPRPSESWHQRLARKAEEIQRRFEEEAGVREPSEERPSARETATRSTPSPGRVARQRETQPPVAAAGRPTTTPRLEPARQATPEPMMEDLSSIMAEPPEPLNPDEIQLKAHRASGGFEPDAVIDYSDPDALKKAVLLYEILGKPLAVRDESEQTRAF